jgi:hypothetical protein
MGIFLGLPPHRVRSRESPLSSSGREIPAMAGRKPLAPRGSNAPNPNPTDQAPRALTQPKGEWGMFCLINCVGNHQGMRPDRVQPGIP